MENETANETENETENKQSFPPPDLAAKLDRINELKARAYDLMQANNQIIGELNQINQEINRLKNS